MFFGLTLSDWSDALGIVSSIVTVGGSFCCLAARIQAKLLGTTGRDIQTHVEGDFRDSEPPNWLAVPDFTRIPTTTLHGIVASGIGVLILGWLVPWVYACNWGGMEWQALVESARQNFLKTGSTGEYVGAYPNSHYVWNYDYVEIDGDFVGETDRTYFQTVIGQLDSRLAEQVAVTKIKICREFSKSPSYFLVGYTSGDDKSVETKVDIASPVDATNWCKHFSARIAEVGATKFEHPIGQR